MDFRFDRIRDHIEGCLLDAGVFERTIDGAQLFDVDIVRKANRRWLVIAAGVTDAESAEFFSDPSKRDRSTTPMQVVPAGTASILLIVRPLAKDASGAPNACVTEFSTDVGAVELYQGCYVRLDALQHPTVQ